MITIGITGGYATGKTLVAGMFKRFGAKVVDADIIAHKVMKPHTSVWQKVVGCFGKEILRRDGLINRKKLGKIIFKDPIKRKKLNKIVHPAVIDEIKQIIKEGRSKIVVVDAPLLFESGIEKIFNKFIVVSCPKKTQYDRAKRRDELSREQILQRIQSQWPIARKVKLSDFVVDNSSSIVETRKQVKKIWNKITSAEERKEVL